MTEHLLKNCCENITALAADITVLVSKLPADGCVPDGCECECCCCLESAWHSLNAAKVCLDHVCDCCCSAPPAA